MRKFFEWNLGNKLLLSFLAILLIPSIIIGTVSFNAAKSKVTQEINDSASESIKLFNQSMTNSINSWKSDVNFLAMQLNNATFVKDSPQDTTTALSTLDNFTSEKHSYQHVYVGTDTGIFDQRPYAAMPPNYDPRKRPWYQDAISHPNTVVVTAPYRDASTGLMVITVARTLPNGHGVIGADITLNSLTDMASQVKIGSHGYLAIYDSNKEPIVDKSVSAGATSAITQLNPLFSSDSGQFSYTAQGNTKVVSFITNPTTGWKIAAVMLSNEYIQAATAILNTSVVVIIADLILGMLLAFLITRSIAGRLNLLVKAAKSVASGNLAEQIQVKSKDELGQLSSSFNQMVQSLRTILSEVMDTAGQVAASSEELTASAEQTSKATEHIATTMQAVAEGTDKQAQSVEESTSVVKEMSSGVQQIAKSAEKATESALAAADAATEGFESLQNFIQKMQRINESVDGLAQMVAQLGEKSVAIGTVVEVITDIASQTNLLALNAAIEAARAGEQGRGFAVVAEEVRKLAEQSAKSASKISDMIGSVQAETTRAVDVTGEVTVEVGEGLNVVNLAGQSFDAIRASVNHVANQIQEVSAAAEQLSASSDEVVNSINQISEVAIATASSTENVSASAQEQLASMEEIAASAQSLANTAEKLQELTNRFKL